MMKFKSDLLPAPKSSLPPKLNEPGDGLKSPATLATILDLECGVMRIAEERGRQIRVGWSPEHDDSHTGRDLIRAAVAYLLLEVDGESHAEPAESAWPWSDGSFKPGTSVENLTRAGALVAAEIDRLQRLAKTKAGRDGTKAG